MTNAKFNSFIRYDILKGSGNFAMAHRKMYRYMEIFTWGFVYTCVVTIKEIMIRPLWGGMGNFLAASCPSKSSSCSFEFYYQASSTLFSFFALVNNLVVWTLWTIPTFVQSTYKPNKLARSWRSLYVYYVSTLPWLCRARLSSILGIVLKEHSICLSPHVEVSSL